MPYRSAFRPGLFEGRGVVVTGGGSGLGRCIAHELVVLGARVALVGRRIEPLERVRDELAREGGDAFPFACDIRDEEGVTAAVGHILGALGRIDGLVNNAGGQFPAQLRDLGLNGWNAVVANNMTGTFLVSREVYRQWMESHGGSIVNVGADHELGMPGMGHSGAARAGMLNFTETAACEWAPVRVNAVAPGWIASSGMDTYPDAMKPLIRSLPKHVPARRLGTEAEVSAAVVFLLSEGAAFVSGSCLRIDGAAPNARRHWPMLGTEVAPEFQGFHRGTRPKVLDD